MAQAERELARAERLGAERLSTYEFFYALEHLKQAREEALEADYGAAVELAEIAYHHAGRAVDASRRAEGSPPTGQAR